MNAYELADAMGTLQNPHPTWTKAANMLRQQADRIAELEKELDKQTQLADKYCHAWHDAVDDKQGEPVYWAEDLSNSEAVSNQLKQELQLNHYKIPLYTTPQTKPLSDEEITKLHLECWDEIEFARAIEAKVRGN